MSDNHTPDRVECCECGESVIRPEWPHVPGMGRHAADRYGLGRVYCESCLTECDYCGEWFYYDVCDHMRHCECCGDSFCGDDYYYCDDCDSVRCEDCGECECCDSAGIHSYGYAPLWVAKGSGVLFGVELEIGGNNADIVRTVRSFDPHEEHLVIKHDGSLDHGGAEIVTHPMSLAWASESYLSDLLRALRSNGCRIPHSGYGLHIHVSRDAFINARGRHSTLHAALWQTFLYRNKPEVETIARRGGSQWAEFRPVSARELRLRASADPFYGERYVAINCQNADTYEVRVFKSTLTPRFLFAALELMDASVEYTRTLTSADAIAGGMEWIAFLRWINADAERAERYAYLVDAGTWACAE